MILLLIPLNIHVWYYFQLDILYRFHFLRPDVDDVASSCEYKRYVNKSVSCDK